jgi:hypothetical protein
MIIGGLCPHPSYISGAGADVTYLYCDASAVPFCISSLGAENGTARLFFHTPHGGSMAVVRARNATSWSPTPVDVTACLWLRTTDRAGGLLAYSAPSAGLEFAMYTQPNAEDSDDPYVCAAVAPSCTGVVVGISHCRLHRTSTNEWVMLCVLVRKGGVCERDTYY